MIAAGHITPAFDVTVFIFWQAEAEAPAVAS